MKLFYLCIVELDGLDGRTTHILEVFKNLEKLCNAHLFTPRPKNCIQELKTVNNVTFVPCAIGKVDRRFSLFFVYQMLLFFNLIHYCKKESPDVIYSRFSPYFFVNIIIAKIFQIPIITEVNSQPIGDLKKSSTSHTSAIITTIARYVSIFNYKHSKKIITVMPGQKKEIRKQLGFKNIELIQNGANTDLFTPIDQEKARRELKLKQTDRYICFVGKLIFHQGLEFLIQAAPFIHTIYPNTKYIIVGDGLIKNELIHLTEKLGVSDKFIFTGIIPYKKVPDYINASDVCVLPLIRERNMKIGSSALKIYEYLACEKPIVASKIPGLDFIEKQNFGILVEPENPDELAKAIIQLLKDKKLRNKMGKNGRIFVIKNNSWKMVAEKVKKVCTEIAGLN